MGLPIRIKCLDYMDKSSRSSSPDRKRHVNLLLDGELYDLVNTYRHTHRISSITEAIRILIRKGASQLSKKKI